MVKTFKDKLIKQTKTEKKPLKIQLIEVFTDHIADEDYSHFTNAIYSQMLDDHWSMLQSKQKQKPKVQVYCPPAEEDQRRITIIDIISKDSAFMVDSIAATINEQKYLIDLLIHPNIAAKYDSKGKLEDIAGKAKDNYRDHSHIHIHLHEILTEDEQANLAKRLESTIQDVFVANQDWKKMLAELKKSREQLEKSTTSKPPSVVMEYCEFLNYLHDNNFTLLGYGEYEFKVKKNGAATVECPTKLGLLKNRDYISHLNHRDGKLSKEFIRLKQDLPPVIIGKTKESTQVHRRVPMDVITVKVYDANGTVVGEKIFLGLFTSVTYSRSVNDIPYLRLKVQRIMDMSDFAPASHDGKALRHILEKYPRDELFQTETKQLHRTCLNILRLQERQRIALFMRKDPFGSYISCLVYVPRDRFGTTLRQEIVKTLEKDLNGTCASFFTSMDDSLFARGLFRIDIADDQTIDYDVEKIEQKLQELGQTWAEKLGYALEASDFTEDEVNTLTAKYGNAFPINYTDTQKAKTAIFDIKKLEDALHLQKMQLDLYRPKGLEANQVNLKIYHMNEPIVLSDIMPILDNMGLRAIAELPYKIEPAGSDNPIWIHDFLLELPKENREINILNVKDIFEEAFANIWDKKMESDKLNRLVLYADMPWRDIDILRTYMKYAKQIRSPHSQNYMQEALTQHAHITAKLVAYFHARLNPSENGKSLQEVDDIKASIVEDLKQVHALNDDRIIRQILNLMDATLRTNFYQTTDEGESKPYISIKLDSAAVKGIPKPSPFREIFVFSTKVEGVHLRGDMIARGGLRWSDRHEDFRTEVLGLMKAQMVKNSVIVPMGSKGGFVVKIPTKSREEFKAAGVECYKLFIRGLLDITDNLDGNRVIPPINTARRDGDDPYLVVAADKGTATFSDIANNLSQDYKFWLDDAFASGGSAGYDHKKMGITARGAWESVKLHFRQLNHNTQTQAFDVVGIGDMGGDVFGNGMLLSEHIRLIGAFNHLHIFCDPDPDIEKSFKERKRLFEAVSGWDDYNTKLLSNGGRIYSRSDKSLKLTKEIKERFDIEEDEVPPETLMKAILKARTDLLWFGGIGTYIKGKSETHADVGDKANDMLRINAQDIRAKVIGEGANLGVTQLGRIEFSQKGGKINTDFIDNSGGVDSSDHEVNIKILLSAVMKNKQSKMDLKARNKLLESMTKDIEDHVLRHNYQQAQAVSLTEMQANENLQLHDDFISEMEREEGLSREIEFLPDSEEIAKRKRDNRGLTRPELSVLISYAKITLTKELLKSDIPDDKNMLIWLHDYFPAVLLKKYKKDIEDHRLAREIIAMAIANSLINRLGPTFIKRTSKKTGMPAADIVRSYMVAREAFKLRELWDSIEALDNKTPASVQLRAMQDIAKLTEYSISWFLTQYGKNLDLEKTSNKYQESIKSVYSALDKLLPADVLETLNIRTDSNVQDGLPKDIAQYIASLSVMSSILDITKLADANNADLDQAARTYFAVGERFRLDWLRQQARFKESLDNWEKEATAGLIDGIYSCQAGLTARILNDCKQYKNIKSCSEVESWTEHNDHIVEHLDPFFDRLQRSGTLDLSMLVIAEQRLRNLYGG